MAVEDGYLILDEADLQTAALDPSFIENDCLFSDGRFTFTPQPVAVLDGACADDGFGPATAVAAALPLAGPNYTAVPLHQEWLDEQHCLVFNPLGNAGVILLNQMALTFLQVFNTPRPLAGAGETAAELAAARKLVRLGLLQPEGTRLNQQKGRPTTLTAWLHVTNACNLRCPYCYLHKTPEQMELAHGRQAIAAIFRSAAQQQFGRVKIKYAGGEATLNLKTVLALHRYAAELAAAEEMELEGVILSNGVAFHQPVITAVKAAGLRVMISLDGVGAVHDGQRPFINGNGSFRHLERSLDLLQANGLTPSISITITSRNLPHLAQTVRYLLGRKLPFSLNFYRENECATAFTDLAYADQEIIAAMQAAFAQIEADLPAHSLLGTILDRTRLDRPHDRPCGVGQTYMVIDQNGRVAKCHMEIEKPITDVHAADPLALIRADTIHLQNPAVEEKEGCRDCHWRFWCAGGCPALTYRTTGRYDIKSPNCHIYQALFPAVLRLEGLRLLRLYRTHHLN